MVATLTVMGVDVSSYVTDWGEIEDIKEVLLARTQLFSGEHSVVVSSPRGEFNPYRAGSLFYGKAYFQSPATIHEDGELVFDGLLKAVKVDKSTRTVVLLMENYLSIPTARLVRREAKTGVNAVSEALGILEDAGLSERVDRNSFAVAAAKSVSATINTDFSDDTNTTVLAAVQALTELASVSLYVRNGIIRAKAVEPYQGDKSGLRFLLDNSNLVNVGVMEEAFDNIKNVVKVDYTGNASLTLRDNESIKRCKGQEMDAALSYGSGTIVIANQASANFYGLAFLQRTSILRRTLNLDGANSLRGIRIGDRHPVTDAYLGLDNEPFEVIETHRAIQSKTINLTLASLR